MESFWLCFIPLFVAVDVIGVLPLYLGLAEGLSAADRQRILVQSVGTALAVALLFLFGGRALFVMLGVSMADFMIAGGALLFALALSDMLLAPEKSRRRGDPTTLGAVPLGVPLMVGPAVLTTIILLADQYGVLPTVASIFANLLLAGAVLWFSDGMTRALGRNGIRIASKVANLILAAIGVHMVRLGVERVIAGGA